MITTREIVDRLKDIYDKLAAAVSFRWGVVTSVAPPLVRLDADTDPVIVGTTVPLTVGSRVLVLLQNRKNTVIGRAGATPQRFASVHGDSKTLSALQSAVLATLTVAGPTFVTVHGAAQARPGGNAAGNLEIHVGGVLVGYQMWHSKSSTSHQWPSLMVGFALPAGSHTITLEGTLGTGSVSTIYDYPTLSAITA